MEKFGRLSFYDIDLKKRYTFDHEDIRFVKKYFYALIISTDQPDGTSIDHKYFSFMVILLEEFWQPTRMIVFH